MLYAQEDDAIVWELLGHATRIWHIASGQLACQDESVLKAARRIFHYWSSRQAWLVRDVLATVWTTAVYLWMLTPPIPCV